MPIVSIPSRVMAALLFTLYVFAVIFVILVAVLAAWSDISGMVIDNIYSILIIVSFVIAYAALFILGKHDIVFDAIWKHIVSALMILILTMILFAMNILGAGDSKLATACALWIPVYDASFSFLFVISIVGGILAFITIVLRNWKPFANPAPDSWVGKAQAGQGSVPYGVAIAVAFFILMVNIGYFDLKNIGAVDIP